MEQQGDTDLNWRALTTGNFGGADILMSDPDAGSLSIKTPLVEREIAIAVIGYEDTIFDASGELPPFMKVYRLPDTNPHVSSSFDRTLALKSNGDNPV